MKSLHIFKPHATQRARVAYLSHGVIVVIMIVVDQQEDSSASSKSAQTSQTYGANELVCSCVGAHKRPCSHSSFPRMILVGKVKEDCSVLQTLLYVSDLARKDRRILNKRYKLYPW